jgi:hypothetical protein
MSAPPEDEALEVAPEKESGEFPHSKSSGRSMSLLFLAAIAIGVAIPAWMNRPTAEPEKAVAVQSAQAAPPAPITPLPIAPSQDDMVRFLNDAIASAQADWDAYVVIRADQYLVQAKKSDSVDQWLLKECARITTEYQQQTWQQATYEGSAKDAEKLRVLLGDSLACLVAIRRTKEGQAGSGRAIAPQPYLDKARIALGQYAAKLGVSNEPPTAPTKTAQGQSQPTPSPAGGKPDQQ